MPITLFDSSGRPILKRGRHSTRFTRNHKLLLGGILAGVLGAIATMFSAAWQTKVSRVAYSGPWLRFQYFVCIGPYNNSLSTFRQLPVGAKDTWPTTEDYERAPKDFVIRNAVYDRIAMMEPENNPRYIRRSQVTSVDLQEAELDRLVGIPHASAGVRRAVVNKQRQPTEVRSRLRNYFEYFRVHRPTIRSLHSIGAAPPWVNALLKQNHSYDEPVDLLIGKDAHSDWIMGTAYFRSVRTIHLRVENVSPHNLTGLELHVNSLGSSENISIASIKTPVRPRHSRFPLNVMKPGEAVVYPLSISLVPHLEASSLMMGSSDRVKEQWGGDEFHESSFGLVKILSSTGQRTLELHPAFQFDKVTFHVENEPREMSETRTITRDEMLKVSKTCECGSCPVLYVRKGKGDWIRAREILTHANGRENQQVFEVKLPARVDEIMIAENPAEVTFLRSVQIIQLLGDKARRFHRVPLPINSSISADSPLRIDLRAFRLGESQLTLRGEGYYVARTGIVCPLVFPLPNEWIDQAIGGMRR